MELYKLNGILYKFIDAPTRRLLTNFALSRTLLQD